MTHHDTPARPGRTGTTVSTEPVDHHTAIAYACNLLDTAPWIVQDDVPLEDVHGWVATIREHASALAAENAALAAYARALERNGVANGTITKLRAKHGITDAMLAAPGPRPGGAETGADIP